MNTVDRYHKWVEWSEEDQAYLGKCPDLITGIHGNDPVRVFEELNELLAEVIEDLEASGRELPTPKVRPMVEATT